MAEIPGQINHDNMIVGFGEFHRQFKAVVRRTVIDQNYFVVFTDELTGCGTCPSIEFSDVGRRLIRGCSQSIVCRKLGHEKELPQ